MCKLQLPEQPLHAPILDVLNELMKAYSNLKELGHSSPIVDESIFKCAALLPAVIDKPYLNPNTIIVFSDEKMKKEFEESFVRPRTNNNSDEAMAVSQEFFKVIMESAEGQGLKFDEKEKDKTGEYTCEYIVDGSPVAWVEELVHACPNFLVDRNFAFKAVPGLKEFCDVV